MLRALAPAKTSLRWARHGGSPAEHPDAARAGGPMKRLPQVGTRGGGLVPRASTWRDLVRDRQVRSTWGCTLPTTRPSQECSLYGRLE